MKVIKRNDVEQDFNLNKIINAIKKAENSVISQGLILDKDKMSDEQLSKIVVTIQKKLEGFNSIGVEDIQDIVESSLVRHNKYIIAKEYILYRDKAKNSKKYTANEEKFKSVVNGTSSLRGDNANKRIDDNSSIRDYAAGILCKSIFEKDVSKDIVKAHKKKLIHWHDSDYSPAQPLHNCDLVNAKDMFDNNFQMSDTLIEPDDETPFRTACNLLAQINLQVSGRQYGGQTVSWYHLVPFIDYSRKQIRKQVIEDYEEDGTEYTEEMVQRKVNKKLKNEIYEGVKTYQYQVLCHCSSSGQTPFVSNNLCLREAENQQELDDFAMLIEAILRRRIKGVKNSSGRYVSPLFPKLLYWTCDGLNVNENDPYFYLTELAAECEIKRTQPDIVSEPETRKVKQGQIIPSMGCRSLLAPCWEENIYPIDTKFYFVKGTGTYPYGKFVDKKTFEDFENRDYKTGYEEGEVAILFAGNTGWLKSKNDKEVTIIEPKVYGRWNNGVVTVNIPHVALEAVEESKKTGEDLMKTFYKIFDERLELCHKALQIRIESCRNIKAKNSAILWQYGALARLKPEQTVGELMDMHPTRASISLGYVGLYETCRALIGESNTSEAGQKLSIEILQFMNDKCNKWKADEGYGYSIYGTPEESTTLAFALANRRDFGFIPYITDKDYVVNSYHVDPREEINWADKLAIEGKYLALSSGGAVSYVETLDLQHNKQAIIDIIKFMHNHIVYAEFNRKIGVCFKCGYEGDIELIKTEDGKFVFKCKNCGNTDDSLMDVTARLCGYLGKVNAGNTNVGRLDDIFHRFVHTDCSEDDYNKLKEEFREFLINNYGCN